MPNEKGGWGVLQDLHSFSHVCLGKEAAEQGRRVDGAKCVPYPLRDIEAMGGQGGECRGAGDGCRAGQTRACMQGPACLVSDLRSDTDSQDWHQQGPACKSASTSSMQPLLIYLAIPQAKTLFQRICVLLKCSAYCVLPRTCPARQGSGPSSGDAWGVTKGMLMSA